MKKAVYILISLLTVAALLSGCALFGSQKAELKLDQTELSMTVGDTAQLSAGDAAKLKWSSSDESVASVHAGTVSAKSAGTADITVSVEGGDSQVCKVTVTDKLISSISLSAKSIKLGLGKTVQISASISPADASDRALEWSSEDESVAVVDQQGFVTGVADGVAIIICESANGVTASCAVTVQEAPEAPTASPETQKPTQAATEPTSDSEATEPSEDREDNAGSSPVSGDYIFPDSSARRLTDSEVKAALEAMGGSTVSGSASQDAINEIFARHGYVFRTASIRAYYESKSWYRADPDFNIADLSDIEEYNIALFDKY